MEHYLFIFCTVVVYANVVSWRHKQYTISNGRSNAAFQAGV